MAASRKPVFTQLAQLSFHCLPFLPASCSDRVLLSCNLTALPLGNATVPIKPSPYLTNGSSSTFPLVGDTRTAWVLNDGPVACPQYNAANRSWVLDPVAPTWGECDAIHGSRLLACLLLQKPRLKPWANECPAAACGSK